MTMITGNTYPVKDRLRALGGKWNRGAQGWELPDEKAEEARAIVAAAGPAKPRDPYRRGRRYGRSQVARCTCEDAPCCGCGE